jgi:hypothetical protein
VTGLVRTFDAVVGRLSRERAQRDRARARVQRLKDRTARLEAAAGRSLPRRLAAGARARTRRIVDRTRSR